MPSLMELVERVNKGELIDADPLEVYQESPNSAEKFLAHHAHAMLDLRKAHHHILQSLEAIDYADQKVLNQFVSVSGFLGLTDLRCGPIVKFGSCAIGRREYALGLEAIQNALNYDIAHNGTYSADRENSQFVAQQFERAAQCIGWTRQAPLETQGKQVRIAYIVSGVSDDELTSRTIASLAKFIDSKRFKLSIHSTEAQVRRDKQVFAQTTYTAASVKRGGSTLDVLNRNKVPVSFAPTDGDVISAAKELANQLARDKADVLIFDVTQADPIASLVALWDVGRVNLNLVRKTPLMLSTMDCVCYFDQNRFDADKDHWDAQEIDSKYLLEGIDLEEPLGPPPQRATYGVPENAVVLTTTGTNLDRTLSEPFVETIINILRAHPQAIYLVVGEADLSAQKRKFESAGVGKRVGYTGRRKDLPGFLRIADVYLSEFPNSDGKGVLQAMSMEKSVVAFRTGESDENSLAATFAGADATVTGKDPSIYIERVSKLIREPQTRTKLGKSMRERVAQHFAYQQTARHIEQLCEQMLQRASNEIAEGTDVEDGMDDLPMAEVA